MFKQPILFSLAAAFLLAACTVSTPQRAPLTLTLRNTDAAEPLRCVLVLAHFVSVDVALIGPGGSRDIVFGRVVNTGSLIVNAADGREMEVENLLCGGDSHWARTRGDVPLLPLRATKNSHLEAACRLSPRLLCEITDL
ncbi:MAG: hypothetical protein ACTSWM_09815 [Alphaproteobacteria bacterium]